MDDESCRLVDDEKVLVLPDDPERDLLCDEAPLLAGRRLELEFFAPGQAMALRPGGAVDAHPVASEQRYRRGAGADLRE